MKLYDLGIDLVVIRSYSPITIEIVRKYENSPTLEKGKNVILHRIHAFIYLYTLLYWMIGKEICNVN